jgi:Cof subfamily protein (haloacid dehalogenase superfamily)
VTYRLLALDLDGTIVDAELRIDPIDQAAVRDAAASGTHVVVCTGRPFPAAVRWVERLGVSGPIVCYQGAEARELDGAMLLDQGVDHALAMEVVETCRNRDLEIHVYRDDLLYTERDRAEVRAYARHAGMEVNVVPDVDAVMGPTTPKLVTVADEQTVAGLMAEFGERWRGRLNVVTSLPTFLEMTSVRADKRAALEFIAARLGVPPEATIAAGDGRNDITMVQWAGLGVAVEGSPPEVIAAADEVIGPPGSGSIARLIAQHGLVRNAPGFGVVTHG